MDNDQKINPWLSIWTNPRLTIRQIIDTDTGYPKIILLLAALSDV